VRYDAILFDFDGVLADTEPVHFAAWREILRPFGIDLDWDTYRQRGMGRPDLTLLESLGALADPPVGLDVLAPWLPNKRKRFVELALRTQPLSVASIEFIQSLPEYKLAIVTSSDRSEIEPLLAWAGVRDRFEALVCGGEAPHPKPAPDPYLLAADLVHARRPLVVEDSTAGLASALTAGFEVVRVASTRETPAAVLAALDSY
jgi:HAD superfamily hydrolase (TIGR01509 family)